MQKRNITSLKPYTSARDLYKKGVFLDANENYQQWVKVDWSKAINLNRYPDSSADELRQAIVKYYVRDFEKENIFVGRGSDEIIDLLIKGFVENDEFIMMMDPSYSVYQVQADINNVGCKKITLQSDFSLNLKEIKNNLSKVKIVFLCSPNNPTGNLVRKEEVVELLKSFSGLLVIDEAYIEYAGLENSLFDLVRKNKRVAVLRTFSKAWGLAGIRLGYVIAQPQVIETLLKIKDSYNISSPSQLVGIQALKQVNQLKKKIKETMSLKAKLEKQLNNLGYETISNEANFILLKIENAKEVYKKLAREGIIVRDRSNLPLLDNVLRITVGSEDENSRLLSLISDINSQKQNKSTFDSVIFDMDGVLVDVTQSYRQAIKKTVEYVLKNNPDKSQKVIPADINAMKKVPGFNNDWDLSFALVQLLSKNIRRQDFSKNIKALNDKTKSSSKYKAVKDIFQSYYLGEQLFEEIYNRKAPIAYKTGLISNETLLLDLPILESLSQKYKLGVATSRPRFEALFALKNLGVTPKYISEENIVAQEDAPKEKPFPDPLLEAQKRLSSNKSVYIGDSVNDLLAAKKASMPCIFVGSNKDADFEVPVTNQIKNILL